MTIYCPACSQRIHPDELCRHPEPCCLGCCGDEHGWYPSEDEAA